MNKFLDSWHNNFEYTSAVLNNDNAILRAVASGLDMRCYSYGHQSHHWIDGVLYCEQGLFFNCPYDQTWLRKIMVAFEHGNNSRSWHYTEVSRFLLVNCESRVLAAYPWAENVLAELNKIHKSIATTDGSDSILKSKPFLIIFGRPDDGHTHWEGRILKSE